MKGFTLIEAIVVISLLAIVSGTVFTGFFGYSSSQKLNAAVEEVVSYIRDAREYTLSGLNDASYGVHFEQDSVTIFPAPTYNAGSTENKVLPIPSEFMISTIDINGEGSDILFAEITGETNQYGSITLQKKGTSAVQEVVNIYATGTVEVQQ